MAPPNHLPINCGHNRFLACFSGVEEQERSSELGCTCATLQGPKRKAAYTSFIYREFVNSATALLGDLRLTNHESLPSLHDAYAKFVEVYPKYSESQRADDIRAEEYSKLKQNDHVCMDYFGIGLFSHLQQQQDLAKSSFHISHSSVNLSSQVRYGAPEKGSLEFDIKKRIFKFLNILENDYCLVFTASRGSAFKLLAESYPFSINKRLLTVYDYESEGLNWMVETSKKKGAKIMSAYFRWPSLRICSPELRKILVEKKKKRKASAKGLFVFPVQSRLTGAKYSYQWMIQAQEKGWHVLLDACALGPKDMDTLGLSLFQPDFIISSFFKVYGTDPAGFGCLFVRKSSIDLLDSIASGVGVVNILPLQRTNLPVSSRDGDEEVQELREISTEAEAPSIDHRKLVTVSSFSGPVSMLNRANLSQKAKSIETSELELSESDYGQSSDTESAEETEPGSKLRKSKHEHRHRSSSFENTDLELTDEYYRVVQDSRQWKVRDQGGSSVHEIEELEADQEWQRRSSIISEQGQIDVKFPDESSEPQEEREAGESESLHLGHKGERSATETSDTDSRRYWSVGESSQTIVNTPIEYKEATKVSLADIFEKDQENSFDENTPTEANISSTESHSANSSEAYDPQIYCRSLDHADSLGLIRINNRMRYLINWLVNALMKLRHPSSDNGHRLVKIYGPKIKFDRGSAVAFNLYDWKGELVEPMLVQKLASRNNILLSNGFLCNIYFPVKHADKLNLLEPKYSDGQPTNKHGKGGNKVVGLTVVTAALGFLTDFEDVYKLWAFIAKFLDADFVAKEMWRYRTLNQQTIEV